MLKSLAFGQADLQGLRLRLILLTGQSVSLGLTLSFLVIASVAILLPNYGPGALPYVYISTAVLGSAAFYGFGALQRRWPLPRLASATLLLVIGFLFVAWAGLAFSGKAWLSLVTMLAFSLFIQVGFILIGGQAGRLLDVRQIKQHFPRVVAGFAIGFMLAGAMVTPLASLLGRSEHLLLAAAACAAGMLAFQLATTARYRDILNTDSRSGRSTPPSPLSRVLRGCFVQFIFLYQMLSAMATQFVEFLVLVAIGSRFTSSDGLARFFGNFTFVLNLTDILFLALAAGFLLSQFGLRLGLAANPGVVTVLLAASALAGIAGGESGTLFFYLLLATRVADISLTDGATRTAINAAYQALPVEERISVQTGVEGIGVPVALGLTGVLLLLFQAVPRLTLIHVILFSLILCLVWLGVGGLVYRGYAAGLLQMLRRRTLDLSSIALEDGASLAVVKRLLRSQRASDVTLALDLLIQADHASLDAHLSALVQKGTPEIRLESLTRIEQRRTQAALPSIQALLATTGDARLLAAALRALCALAGGECATLVLPYLDYPDAQVREAALVGLLCYTGAASSQVGVQRLAELELSTDAAQRRLAARVIGAVKSSDFARRLDTLLRDPDFGVRREALLAAAQACPPSLLPMIVDNLAQPALRSAAMEALVVAGDAILPLVEAALASSGRNGRATIRRLVRAAGQVGSKTTTTLLLAHFRHPDNEIRTQILEALHSAGCRLEDSLAINAVLRQEVQYGLHLLAMQQACGEEEGLEPLWRSLGDEWGLLLKRVFLLLRFVYDPIALAQVDQHLANGDGAQKALALEMLEVNLSVEHRSLVFPLVNPQLTAGQRLGHLMKYGQVALMERDTALHHLIANPDGVWTQNWLRACAIYAAARLGLTPLACAIHSQLDDPDPDVRETAAWALQLLGSTA